jgi:hypothetical protein
VLRLAGWVSLSALVHGGLLAVVLLGVAPVRWTAVEPEPLAIEVVSLPAAVEPERPIEPEVRLDEPLPDEHPTVTPPAPEQRDAPRERPRDTSRDTPPSPSTPDPSATEGPTSVSPPTPSVVEVPQVTPTGPVDERERERLRALLDPSAVARGGFDFGPGPSQRGAPAGLASLRDGTGPSEQEIERNLGSGLRAEAMTKTHTAREPFVLQRRADGTQVWNGPRLTGIINPDGTVRFEHRPNVQTNGFSTSGTFDLTEAVIGASGQNPLAAEEEYFMRQTEELRARLEAEHRRREMAEGLQRLRGRLERIWSTTSRSPSARRARIFSLWDEADESDENGREARAIIIRWIRERLPEGSEDAYTQEEIRRLNASRESHEEFAPY